MAIAATVATAIVDFKGRSLQFTSEVRKAAAAAGIMPRELAKVERSINAFNRRVATLIRNVTGIRAAFAALVAVVGAGALIKRIADTTAQIEIQSRTIGVNVELLQELRHAGELLQLSAYQVGVGFQRFSRHLGDASRGGGELLPIFRRLNIEITDNEGNLRPTVDVLFDYADATKDAASRSQQLLLAFKAFDIEGARLVTLLRQGREGIMGFQEEANRLGLVLGEDLLANARLLHREFNILTRQIQTGFQRAILENTPQILDVLRRFGEQVPSILGALPELIGRVGTAVTFMVSAWTGLFIIRRVSNVMLFFNGILIRLVRRLGVASAALTAFKIAAAGAGGSIGLIITAIVGIGGAIAAFLGLRKVMESATAQFETFEESLQFRSVASLEKDLDAVNAKIVDLIRVLDVGNFVTVRGEQAIRRQIGVLIRTQGVLQQAISEQRALAGGELEDILGEANAIQQAITRLQTEIVNARSKAQGLTTEASKIESILGKLSLNARLDPQIADLETSLRSFQSQGRIREAIDALNTRILATQDSLDGTSKSAIQVRDILAKLTLGERLNNEVRELNADFLKLQNQLESQVRVDRASEAIQSQILSLKDTLAGTSEEAIELRKLIGGLFAEDLGDFELGELISSFQRLNSEVRTKTALDDLRGRITSIRLEMAGISDVSIDVGEILANLTLNERLTPEIREAAIELFKLTQQQQAANNFNTAIDSIKERITSLSDEIRGTSDLAIFLRDTLANLTPKQLQNTELLELLAILEEISKEANTFNFGAELEKAAGQFARTFGKAFNDFIRGATSAREAMIRLLNSIADAISQAIVLQGLAALGIGSVTQSFASGGLAHRGLAVVGERGPEIVDFQRPSRVYSTRELANALDIQNQGSGGDMVVNIDARGATDPFDIERRIRALLPDIATGFSRFGQRDAAIGSRIQVRRR